MRHALRGRYVFPVTSPAIADGVVTIEDGRIVAVGRDPVGRCPVTDLGNVAILPGFVNAHTHLEFSGLAAPLGEPGMSLPDWIRLVVGYRRQLPADSQRASIQRAGWHAHLGRAASQSADSQPGSIERGAAECRESGTVAVGEIATTHMDDSMAAALPHATVFREIIGLKHELIEDRLAAAREYLARTATGPHPSPHPEGEGTGTTQSPRGKIWPGISPHAPYSVHPELFERLVGVAQEAHVPVAFHLAETREELELLATGGGPFRDLLIELGAWDETAIPRGSRPIDYLRRLADRGVHALVIHGNYLDVEEIEFLGAHADRLTVVYCPRTHVYFGHERHPLPRLLAAGANVALGTDSRASNPDLNLLEEIRFVARCFPEIPPHTALELGTLRAARALRIDDRLGSLEPGKLAELATVPLPNADASDPYLLLYGCGGDLV